MPEQPSRRQFLIGAGAAVASGAVALTVARHRWADAATHRPAASPAATGSSTAKGRILVLVTLYGGNDGLNTVIPTGDPAYQAGRPTLGYPAEQLLPLGDGLGLHPNLKGMKALWDRHQLAIVRGVGYPNPIRSHFRSMDIWQSASPDTVLATGWLGRWLDATGRDPMRALSIGTTLPLALVGEQSFGTAIGTGGVTLTGGGQVTGALGGLWAPGSDRQGLAGQVASAGSDLLTVQHDLASLLRAATSTAAAGAGSNHLEISPTTAAAGATSPAGAATAANPLAAQLDLVARLVRAGAPTQVYQVSLGGFDNHAAEKDVHARLLGQLDEAVSGFFDSLGRDPHGQGVVLMTVSEFGRRVAENASGGTDHGTASPLFVAGVPVKGGQFYGDEPSLTDLDAGDLRFTTDFRAVYATVLGQVVGVDPAKIITGAPAPLAFL